MYVIYYPLGVSMYKGFLADNGEIARQVLQQREGGKEVDFAFPSEDWKVYKISEFEPPALRKIREALTEYDLGNINKHSFLDEVRKALNDEHSQAQVR